MKKRVFIALLIVAMALATGSVAFASETPDHTVEYITMGEKLDNGNQLIMCGIAAEQKDAFIADFEKHYHSGKAYKYVEPSFIDAEKYNGEATEEITPFDDHSFCWACSISNMLWMSGWADDLSNPLNGEKFCSEDDVFTYYYSRFVNGGSDTFPGVEFFFDGHYFKSYGNEKAGLCDPDDRTMFGDQIESDGLRKDVAVSEICVSYDLTRKTSDLKRLEKIHSSEGGNSVFQASVGSIDGAVSTHSVNVAGILIDPEETSMKKRYLGILITDSDNDATPGKAMTEIKNPTDEQREADRKARDNSYTFYPLKYTRDTSGNDCWEIVGYSKDERTKLFGITELKCRTAELAAEAIETEGSRNSLEDVDLSAGRLFTTSVTRAVDLEADITNVPIKTSFAAGTPVRLNFELQNRSAVALDEKYSDAKAIIVKYNVFSENGETRSSVKAGTICCDLPLTGIARRACLICLNDTEGKSDIWPVGRYEVALEINPATEGKRAIDEAYYKNNISEGCTFTVIPPAKAIKTVAAGRKKLTIKWKRSSDAYLEQTSGYQVQYSTTKTFKSKKTETVKRSATSKTIRNLKSHKKYYVKMRTYKLVNGQKYYSAWSNVKARKTR